MREVAITSSKSTKECLVDCNPFIPDDVFFEKILGWVYAYQLALDRRTYTLAKNVLKKAVSKLEKWWDRNNRPRRLTLVPLEYFRSYMNPVEVIKRHRDRMTRRGYPISNRRFLHHITAAEVLARKITLGMPIPNNDPLLPFTHSLSMHRSGYVDYYYR